MKSQLTPAASGAQPGLRFAARRFREHCRRGRVALRLFARTALRSRADGTLVLPGAGYRPGLFSQFATVLGLLEHFEARRDRYAGLRVDFGTEGLYYEPAAGPNWWNYYFEPIAIGESRPAATLAVDDDEQFYFARRVETGMPRRLAARLIERHVRPRPRIVERVRAFAQARFEGRTVIGVHYRGTDKHEDAPRVPYEQVEAAVREAMTLAPSSACAIFAATDEQAFLDFLKARFPGQVNHLDMLRSTDGTPIDVIDGDNARKGEDAVVDSLLLARCHRLIRTASNLSLCAGFFNPELPVMQLNRER